jgi:hypothetical protein
MDQLALRQQPSDPVGGRRSRVVAQAWDIGVDIAPVLLYTVVNALTNNLGLAVALAVGAGCAATGWRLLRRRAPWRSVPALVLVVIGALLAGRSGEASEFFLPQVLVGGVWTVLNVVLTALRLPPAGLVMGYLDGGGLRWRRCRVRVRGYTAASLVYLVSQVLGTGAMVPLYLTGDAVGLGVVDVVDPFVTALAVVVAVWVYRRTIRGHTCDHVCGQETVSSSSRP